jgi:hypothetical protein
MSLRDVLSTYALPIGIGLGLLWALARQRRTSQTASPVDTKDPIWIGAIAAAKASRVEMLSLHSQYGAELFVKYPLRAKNGEIEHVWGPLLESKDDSIKVGLATPPVGGLDSEPPFTLASYDLEDWQLVLPDGMIRGGFTTQAQIALTKKAGWPVPQHIKDLESKFLDVLRVAT